MGELPTAEDIAEAASEVGLSLTVMCQRAGTAYTTFYRWKQGGTAPSLDYVQRWLNEIDRHRHKDSPTAA